jgi:rhodanese-related sulfurtransferase
MKHGFRLRVAFALAVCAGVVAGGAFGDAPAAQRDYADPDRLAALIADQLEPYILVDVRTAAEYDPGHIPTALTIPVDTIADNPPTADLSALIIVYCRSGARSSTAAGALRALGYSRVVDFGSVSRWRGELVATAGP